MAKITKFNCAILALAVLVGISMISFNRVEGSPLLDRFVLFAANTIHLAKDVQVKSGDVGVNGELYIGGNSILNSNLFADKIHLAENSKITGSVSYNELKQAETSEILGEKISPISLPIAQLPLLSSDFGTSDQSLTITEEQTISPGNYDKIEIKKNGKLTLEPGTYNLNELALHEAASLFFSGATVINIKDKFKAGEKAVIKDLDSLFSNLTINYQGKYAVTFGDQSSLIFKITAPYAEIHLGEGINFQGSIYADKIYIAERSILEVLPLGPPPSPVAISGAPGFQPCQRLWEGRNVLWACDLYITSPSADIIWDTSTDPNFDSYQLYRAEHPQVTINDNLIIKNATQGGPANILFYRDNTLELDKIYYYRLFVFDKSGFSSGSNEIIVKTFSQTVDRVVNIPEPGDTQYPPDVAIPYYVIPEMQSRCQDPDPFYYWNCQNYYYSVYGPRIDELGQIYKYRYFNVPINSGLLNNATNLKFYLRNFEVWTTYYTAQDNDYTISIPPYGISVNIPKDATRMLQMQVSNGVFNIILEAVGLYQPEAGTFYVSP